MRKTLFLFVLAVLVLRGSAFAEEGFGAGVMFGEPTGLSLKSWINQKEAVDAGIAWSFTGEDSLHLHADYLYHMFDIFKVPKGKLPLYVGVGGRIKFEDDNHDSDTRVGVRIPVGVSYFIEKTRLEVFLEVVPILDLAPDTDGDLNAAIGMRYYFSGKKKENME